MHVQRGIGKGRLVFEVEVPVHRRAIDAHGGYIVGRRIG